MIRTDAGRRRRSGAQPRRSVRARRLEPLRRRRRSCRSIPAIRSWGWIALGLYGRYEFDRARGDRADRRPDGAGAAGAGARGVSPGRYDRPPTPTDQQSEARRPMTNVLITGGAGFIGSHLTDRLLERGDSVLVIDNFATARRDTLPAHDEPDARRGHDRRRRSRPARLRTSSSPEVVVHAAASYKDPDAWTEDSRTNARRHRERRARRAGGRRRRASSTSRRRSATGCIRRSSRSRCRIRSIPRTRATRSRRRRASSTCGSAGSTGSRSASPTSTARAT